AVVPRGASGERSAAAVDALPGTDHGRARHCDRCALVDLVRDLARITSPLGGAHATVAPGDRRFPGKLEWKKPPPTHIKFDARLPLDRGRRTSMFLDRLIARTALLSL